MSYYRNRKLMVVEWVSGKPTAYHVVTIPGLGLPGGYISIISADAFRKRESRRSFGFPGKKPKVVPRIRYHLRWAYDYLISAKSDSRVEKITGKTWRKGLPIHKHKSLWDFYNYIGYDHKKNRYNRNIY